MFRKQTRIVEKNRNSPSNLKNSPQQLRRGFLPKGVIRGRFSIKRKVFALLLVQSAVVVIVFSILVGWAFDKGFAQYMNQFNDQRAQSFANALRIEYQTSHSWTPLIQRPGRWGQLAMQASGHTSQDLNKLQLLFSQFRNDEFPGAIPTPLPMRFVLLDASNRVLIGSVRPEANLSRWEIKDDHAVVGYLALTKNNVTPYDIQFRQRFLTALLVIIASSVVLAILPAFFIARFVTRAVDSIAHAARLLAAGLRPPKLPIVSDDELGDLAQNFNELSFALERSDNHQRQWLAEISHELRTPVTILLAQSEAVLDGIRPATTEAFRSLHEETGRLSRLIEDLHVLSLLDGGDAKLYLTEININQFLENCINSHETIFNAKNIKISLITNLNNDLKLIGDKDKLHRVFNNLLENSARYTDEGGKVNVQAKILEKKVVFVFEDSSPGVPEGDLPFLFDRLYRGESSRSRSSGGSGLGLSIVKSIIEAHSGQLTVMNSALGGVRFEIKFDLLG